MRNNQPVTNNNIDIPSEYRLISRTDLVGNIIEANYEFIKISGYEEHELIGQPHNLLRHPDVPEAVFEDAWKTIQSGKAWTQIVKNRAKNGDAYWVKANMAPVIEEGQIVGYISIRKAATPSEVKAATEAYEAINNKKLIIKDSQIYTPMQYFLTLKNPFNALNLMGKLTLTSFILILLGLVITTSIAMNHYYDAEMQNENTLTHAYDKELALLEKNVLDAELNTAISVASMPSVQTALLNNNKASLKLSIETFINNFQQINGVKPKLHIHTPNSRSYLRSWRDKSGDDLSDFRFSVNKIAEQNKPLQVAELGRAGIAIRSLAPIFAQNGQSKTYVGSVEAINTLDKISEVFASEEIYYLTLLTKDAIKIAKKAQNNQKVGNYILGSDKFINEKMLAELKAAGTDLLIEEGKLKTQSFFHVAKPIKDARDELVGYHVVSEELSHRYSMLDDKSFAVAKNSIFNVVMSMILLTLGYLIILYFQVIRPVKKSVAIMNQSTKDGDLTLRLDDRFNDEMGKIAKAYNLQMQTTQIAMGEAGRMVRDLSEGKLDTKTTIPMQGDFFVTSTNLNKASDSLKATFTELKNVINQILKGNFDYHPQLEAHGEFKQTLHEAEAVIEELQSIFDEINNVMQEVSQGYFNYRVNSELSGEYDVLKQNINSSLVKLESAISDTTNVMLSQGTGDLTARINSKTKGTLAILKSGVNNSIINIASIIAQSNYSVNKLSQNALAIGKDMQNLAERTSEQSAAVESTASSMEEITSTIQQTSVNAKTADDMAHESLQESKEANQVVHKTIQSINEINEASNKISEITALIDSIAFQTNLLALNAAVEAARAGEHGRGFAVVASEVRSLAGKSADAAKEIRTLIEDTVEKVKHGSELANQSGTALEVINQSMEKVGSLINEISKTTEEQAIGVDQVNEAIRSIDHVTQKNSQLVQQTSERTSSMTQVADQVITVSQNLNIDLEQIDFTQASQTGDFTFANARKAHRQWRGVIHAFVAGMDIEFNPETATNHTKCALGQWLYGEEGQGFMHLNAMQSVEKYHTELHAIIKQILDAHALGDENTVSQLFNKLDDVSDQVINNLSAAEKEINNL